MEVSGKVLSPRAKHFAARVWTAVTLPPALKRKPAMCGIAIEASGIGVVGKAFFIARAGPPRVDDTGAETNDIGDP